MFFTLHILNLQHNPFLEPDYMDFFYLGILLFLIVLATFDLSVGVANDAVNFLSPAVGAKAAKFRTILLVAAIGGSSHRCHFARHLQHIRYAYINHRFYGVRFVGR